MWVGAKVVIRDGSTTVIFVVPQRLLIPHALHHGIRPPLPINARARA